MKKYLILFLLIMALNIVTTAPGYCIYQQYPYKRGNIINRPFNYPIRNNPYYNNRYYNNRYNNHNWQNNKVLFTDKEGNVFDPNGDFYAKDNNIIWGSNGKFYKQEGDVIYGSDGKFYKQNGSLIIGSDGSVCHKIGGRMMCTKK